MTLALLLTAVTGAWADGIVCTASDLGKVLCTDGSIYENVSAATTAGKTAAAVIAYVDETNKNGLAIALADESNLMNWSTAKSTCEGKTPAITGAKWCLPSLDQWKQMFKANGGNEDSCTGLNTTITTAGGTALEEGEFYWSSSETDPGFGAYIVHPTNGEVLTSDDNEINGNLVRACLAFDIADDAIDVTTNAASEQDLFTEAWFEMPTSDVTVNYTLVRDMQDKTNPVAFTGLPSSGNIVVKKGDNGKYQPAEALTIQLIDPLAAAEAQNIIAADGITVKVLVGNGGTPIEYDQDNPITFEDFLADMKPGYYWIKAEPTDENSPYDGTVYSSEFTVVEQYDLTVKPANDFSKKGLDAVTVGTESVTIDATTGEATKTGIAPETEVKVKAKRGYVIDKVEAKKKAAPAKPEYADNAEELPANTKLYMRTDLVYNGDWIWNPTYTAEQAQAVANYYAAITGTKCAVIYGHGSGTDIYYVTSDNGVNETIYRNNDLTEKFPGYKVYLLK